MTNEQKAALLKIQLETAQAICRVWDLPEEDYKSIKRYFIEKLYPIHFVIESRECSTWEPVTAEITRSAAMKRLKEYRTNEPDTEHRCRIVERKKKHA